MKYSKENLEKRRKRVEFVKQIFVTIAYIILIPIIFYNTIVIFSAATNGNETPSVFGIKTFVIISGSMEPSLKIGDVIIVRKFEEKDLNKDDIISFRNGEAVITHRINKIIIENGKIKYETKGDNNNITDNSYVRFEDVEGKMEAKIPFLGNIALMLKNKVIIMCILMLFYIMYMHNANSEERRISRKEKRRTLKSKYEK